jgi:hypothetical protein
MHSLCTSVDVRNFGLLLHPKWDQPHRAITTSLSVSRVDPNDRDLIGRGDVVARRNVGLRQPTSLEQAAISIPRDQVVVASAQV